MQTIKASLRKIDIVVEELCQQFAYTRARTLSTLWRGADGTRRDGTGRDNTERDGTGWDRRHGTEQDGTGIEYRSVRASLITINAKNEQADFQAMPSP